MGIVFRKAFRILGLGERKGRWVMEQDFHGDFQVIVTWFFASFSGILDWIVLILVWFERSLHSVQVSGQSCPWPLKLMTSKRVERTWIHMGGYGRFRGEWVKDFSDTKVVYQKIVELLVFVWTNTVTHLLCRNLLLSIWLLKISPIDCSFDCVSFIFIFVLFKTHRVNTTI